MSAGTDTRYSISEAAKLLDRSPQTLRSWDRNGSMPERLRPPRDEQGNRYWTPKLIEEIKKWIAKTGFHPGRGIDYHPSPERLQAHIDRIRSSSSKRSSVNGKAGALQKMIEQAITELKLPQDEIVASLPKVVTQDEYAMPLGEALRIASEVFSAQ